MANDSCIIKVKNDESSYVENQLATPCDNRISRDYIVFIDSSSFFVTALYCVPVPLDS